MNNQYQFIEKYSDFNIFLRNSGFETLPNAFGKVAVFIVQNSSGVAAVFAFAYPGLSALLNPSLTEAEVLKKAIVVIKSSLDQNQVQNNQEYTFEYSVGNEFGVAINPQWWAKTT